MAEWIALPKQPPLLHLWLWEGVALVGDEGFRHLIAGRSSPSGPSPPIQLWRSHCRRTIDISPLKPGMQPWVSELAVRVSSGLSSRTLPRKRQRSVPSSRHSVQHHPQGRIQDAGSALQGSSLLICLASSPSPPHSCSDTLDTFPLSPLLPSSLPTEGQEHIYNSAIDKKRAAEPSCVVLTAGPCQAPGEAGPRPTQ